MLEELRTENQTLWRFVQYIAAWGESGYQDDVQLYQELNAIFEIAKKLLLIKPLLGQEKT